MLETLLTDRHFQGFRRRRKLTPEELSTEGKTAISFLQEYCINILRTPPEYKIEIQGLFDSE